FSLMYALVAGDYFTCGQPAASHVPSRRLLLWHLMDYRGAKGKRENWDDNNFTLYQQLCRVFYTHLLVPVALFCDLMCHFSFVKKVIGL
ncbi:hypothetical protein ACJX0J_039193, partial [Zea mays]